MAKTIKIEYKGKPYVLEFTRESVKQLENSGFKVNEIGDFPVSMYPKFFYGAFRANHPQIRMKLTDEIYENLSDRDKILDCLFEMYADTIETLLGSGKGNVKWEAVGF